MLIPTSIQQKKGTNFHAIFHNHRQPCYTGCNEIHIQALHTMIPCLKTKSSTTRVQRQFSRYMSVKWCNVLPSSVEQDMKFMQSSACCGSLFYKKSKILYIIWPEILRFQDTCHHTSQQCYLSWWYTVHLIDVHKTYSTQQRPVVTEWS